MGTQNFGIFQREMGTQQKSEISEISNSFEDERNPN